MMKINIRKATPEDAEGVCAILNPIIREGKQTVLDREYTPEEEAQFITNFSKRGIFLVAETDGKILGFQTMEPYAGYTKAFDHVGIAGTYVLEGCRGLGIGKQLFAKLCEMAPALGYEKIFTYILANNKQSIGYYTNLGFRIIGIAEKQAKIKGRYEDEVLVEYFFAR